MSLSGNSKNFNYLNDNLSIDVDFLLWPSFIRYHIKLFNLYSTEV